MSASAAWFDGFGASETMTTQKGNRIPHFTNRQEEAEYWDAPSRSMVKLFGFATSEEREVDVTNSGRAGEPSQPGSAASRAPQ